MMVEEGEGGCPEGSVSRPVRERQLSRQRGAQREGAGGGAPTSLCYAHTGLPYLRGLSSTAASIPRTLLCSGPVLSCTAGSPCSTWVSGPALSRRGFPCSTWVSGPVLCRAGAFPAARGSGSTPSSSGGLSLQHVGQWSCSLSCGDFPCSTWVRVHPIPGAPAPLFADILFQTPGPTQPWFPRAYLAAPSAFPAHF